MRAASYDLQTLLASGQFFMADLYQFTLTDGTVLQYTSFNQDIGGYSSALGWERSTWKLSVGLNVDTMDIKLHATPTDFIPSTTVPVIEHIASGAWDGAAVVISRAIMPTPGDISAGTIPIFSGWIGDITEIGSISCSMQAQSKLALLNLGMPKALFQPGCTHVLYDAGCTLNRAAFTITGSVAAGSTVDTIQAGGTVGTDAIAGPASAPSLSSTSSSDVFLPAPATYYVRVSYVTAYGESTPSPEASHTLTGNDELLVVASPPSAAGVTGWNVYVGASSGDDQLQNGVALAIGSSWTMPGNGIYLSGTRTQQTDSQGWYALGTITFTSGVNNGVSRTIDSSNGGALKLRIPLFYAPATGDTFTLTAGCDHTMATCREKFDNLIHFTGCPFIPLPELGT